MTPMEMNEFLSNGSEASTCKFIRLPATFPFPAPGALGYPILGQRTRNIHSRNTRKRHRLSLEDVSPVARRHDGFGRAVDGRQKLLMN